MKGKREGRKERCRQEGKATAGGEDGEGDTRKEVVGKVSEGEGGKGTKIRCKGRWRMGRREGRGRGGKGRSRGRRGGVEE